MCVLFQEFDLRTNLQLCLIEHVLRVVLPYTTSVVLCFRWLQAYAGLLRDLGGLVRSGGHVQRPSEGHRSILKSFGFGRDSFFLIGFAEPWPKF